jgi:hypothetical protein
LLLLVSSGIHGIAHRGDRSIFITVFKMWNSPGSEELTTASAADAPPRPDRREIDPRSAAGVISRWTASWPVHDVIVPFIVTRLLLGLVGWMALITFQSLPASPGSWELKPTGEVAVAYPYLSPSSYPLLNIYSRWDGGWYHSIAKQGYNFHPGRQSNTAFFPLYPLLMQAAHLLSPSDSDASWILCGWIVSNAALLVALFYLILLLRLDFDHRTAARAALYLLVFPTTFFFSAVYSESVFIAATLAAFYYARQDRWIVASLCAGAATLTRSPGVILAAPLLLEYLAQRKFRLRDIRPNIVALGIIPVCVLLHMLYLRWRVGNFMAIQDAQRAWGGEWGTLSWPWNPLLRFIREPVILQEVVNVTAAGVAILLVAYAIVRLRPSYGVYAAASYVFITSWGTFESMPRYILIIFPMFAVLAVFGRNEIFHRAYLIFSTGLASFFMIRFALWRWVA